MKTHLYKSSSLILWLGWTDHQIQIQIIKQMIFEGGQDLGFKNKNCIVFHTSLCGDWKNVFKKFEKIKYIILKKIIFAFGFLGLLLSIRLACQFLPTENLIAQAFAIIPC